MKAAIFEGAGKPLVLRSIDDPTADEGEVVIKVGRCGVCGTDLHMTSGHATDFPAGTILGHEYAGEIVEIGAGVTNFKIGDIITAMPCKGCGKCAACLAGAPLMCARMQGLVGGFGEYLRAAATSAVKLPASLSLADGALVEPLCVGLHGVSLAQLVPGARVLVLGAGSVGLAAIFWARQLGAGKVAAASRAARRAGLALQLGADDFVQFGDGEAERIADVLGGPPDVVLEAAGAVGMLNKAVELVRPNGLIVSMGFCTSPDPILPSLATWKQVRLAFSMGYTLQEFQFCTDILAAGHLEPRLMVTETVGLNALPEAFEALRAGSGQTKLHVNPWA
jgi:2-desacetyl-2-hydroxyethyl bacteriochlorophyllide A dehydrogenase